MNSILNKIKELIHSNLESYLPHVNINDLEKDGAVYYMNGRDGTEFDWYVNDKLPPFMVFYNDEKNMGAVKLLLYSDKSIEVYLYDENGEKLIKEVNTYLDVNETDLFELAILLRHEADDKRIWGAAIESINTDIAVTDEMIQEFKENKGNYAAIKSKKILLSLKAIVSKKITDEGWKVGYMERNTPHDGDDSGWVFFAGNESREYTLDYRNMALISIGAVCQQLDTNIFKYIDMPVRTKLIRISPDAFEPDQNDREIFMVKR